MRVMVRDSGPGVAPELAEEVFEHGFTTKAAADGQRGIGLALIRMVCARRGGRVSVRNDDGAVFTAELPAPPGRAVISTLVVDDDFMVAKIHAAFVGRTPGFEVVRVVHTGADALRAVHELHPDLVLLDIYLPDRNGVEVLERLRAETPDVDVLVITAAREVDTVRRALRGGRQLPHQAVRVRGAARAPRALRRRPPPPGRGHRRRPGRRRPGVRGKTLSRPLPKGLSTETAELVRTCSARPRPTCRPPSAPPWPACRGSAPGATSSSSPRRAGSRSGCATGPPASPERRYRWRTS